MSKVIGVVGVLMAVLAAVVLSDRPLPPAEFTYIEPSDVNTLDPQRMSYSQDFRLCYALYEGLLRWDTFSADLRIVPALARSWEASPDRRTYTFRLDPSARWSNADPVTAADFCYAWQRALQPETAADYTKLFFCIRGASDYFEWRGKQLEEYARRPEGERTQGAALALREESNRRYSRSVGIEALDPHTLRVTLVRPTPYFLDLCAFGPFHPVHPATVEAWVDLDPSTGAIRQRHDWTKPPHLVGNGPYVLRRWRFKRDMRLERNPFYRDPGLARSASIQILFIEEQNTAVLAFDSGAADWHSDIEVEYISDMFDQKRRGLRDNIHAINAWGTYIWSFNCTPTLTDGRPNPFHDPRVRRAFAMGVNKADLVTKVRRSAERVAGVFIPPGSIPGFHSPAGLPYDLERARRELADAGWIDRSGDGIPESPSGEQFPVVEMLCTPVGPHKDVALAMGRMWEEAFGVRTKVIVKETKVYAGSLDRRDYIVARGSWYGDYMDPTTFLDVHQTGDGNNDRGFSDPRFDSLLERAQNEPDPDKRMRHLEEAERYTTEEALPILPLWHYDQYYMYRPPVDASGRPNPRGLARISSHPRLVQYLFDMETVEHQGRSAARAAAGATGREEPGGRP